MDNYVHVVKEYTLNINYALDMYITSHYSGEGKMLNKKNVSNKRYSEKK